MGVGVDRLDYTKGILERFLAVERFLEKYPRYQGVFTFVQIGAPSRTHIKRYHDLQAEVEAEADRINWRFQADQWKPIVLLNRQHSHKEIEPYYRAADLCLVTSLHDGMNLVAKEFVATRQDERGVLILSCFTGAARELRDALQVNPYDIDQTAEAIRAALEMQPEEKQARMQRMRKLVREHNVYRWAGTSDWRTVRSAPGFARKRRREIPGQRIGRLVTSKLVTSNKDRRHPQPDHPQTYRRAGAFRGRVCVSDSLLTHPSGIRPQDRGERPRARQRKFPDDDGREALAAALPHPEWHCGAASRR